MKNWGTYLLVLAGAASILAACNITNLPAGSPSPLIQPAEAVASAVAEVVTETATGAAIEAATEIATRMPAADPTRAAAGSGVSVSWVPGELLNSILADAGERLGVEPDTLVVTRAEAVTWNNGALGCPEPGMFYTQALIDGYQIVVSSSDEALDYRAQSSGFFRVCE